MSALHPCLWPGLLCGVDRPPLVPTSVLIFLFVLYFGADFPVCPLLRVNSLQLDSSRASETQRSCSFCWVCMNSWGRFQPWVVQFQSKDFTSSLWRWNRFHRLGLVLWAWPRERPFWCPGPSKEKRAARMPGRLFQFCKKCTHTKGKALNARSMGQAAFNEWHHL